MVRGPGDWRPKTMSTMKYSLRFVAGLFALGLSTGCESSGGGSSSSSAGVYYGVGFYSPYYYGDYDHDIDIDISPPDRPDRPDRPVHPEQPIARPPTASARPSTASSQPAARSTPSIPSTPRATPHVGGGGRR
jgi:hypothetical protein